VPASRLPLVTWPGRETRSLRPDPLPTTALYEIALVGSGGERLSPAVFAGSTLATGELARLRLRYKQPKQTRSRLIEPPLPQTSARRSASLRLQFAAAVADPHEERAELRHLIELAAALRGVALR
jgi:hypothetical protein